MTTTAYLSDGRSVDVPKSAVEDWRYEVQNTDTTLGLADWFTACGDENTDLIQDAESSSPYCNHRRQDSTGSVQNHVRVTNASQLHSYDREKPHASVWVCGRRACVLDAMSWVERTTGERALWTSGTGDTSKWWTLPPETDVVSSVMGNLQFPLSTEIAAEVASNLHNTFVIPVPIDGLLEAISSVDLDQNIIVEDWIHPQVLTFGSPHDCSWRLLAVDGEFAIVEYTTDVAEALAQWRDDTLF